MSRNLASSQGHSRSLEHLPKPLVTLRRVSEAGAAHRIAGTAAVDAPCAVVRIATPSEPGDGPEHRSGYQLRCGSSY